MNDKIFNKIREGILEVWNTRSISNEGQTEREGEERTIKYINKKIRSIRKQKKLLLVSPADAVYIGQSYIPHDEEESQSIKRIVRLYELDEIIWVYAQFRYIVQVSHNEPIHRFNLHDNYEDDTVTDEYDPYPEVEILD